MFVAAVQVKVVTVSDDDDDVDGCFFVSGFQRNGEENAELFQNKIDNFAEEKNKNGRQRIKKKRKGV